MARRNRRGSGGRTVVLLALVAGAAVAGWRFRPLHPTAAELGAVPAATSLYPGSKVVRQTPLDGERSFSTSTPSSVATVACAGVSSAKVKAWYAAELKQAGWVLDENRLATTDRWLLGDRTLELVVLSTEQLRTFNLGPRGSRPCRGGYETVVQ